MKWGLTILGLALSVSLEVLAQDTFSIVAVDSTTGEVGSAGATCLDDRSFPGSGGAIIISDVQPGIGAVHTQSFYIEGNQNNGRARLLEGQSAEEIIQWLVDNDVQNSSPTRQYGAVTLDTTGKADAFSFTGAQCLDAKGHLTGPNYAIQGNILIEESILDSMQANFIRTSGPLCDRLMAALQGANIPGADRRCLSEGVSSQSAFIRVARPNDDPNNLWMDLNVPFTGFGVEPIDELQKKFDDFKSTLSSIDHGYRHITLYPVPAVNELRIQGLKSTEVPASIEIMDLQGVMMVVKRMVSLNDAIDISDIPTGQYFVLIRPDGQGVTFSSKVQIIK